MPSTDDPGTRRPPRLDPEEYPEKYLRWRVVVGDPAGRTRRRWPVALLGSHLTRVPEPPGAPGRTWQRLFVARMMVVAESPRWLRHLLDHPVSRVRARRVTVVVAAWQIPQRGWSGRLGPLPHLLNQRIRLPRRDAGRVVVEVELRWSVPLRAVVAAVLPLLVPVRPLPAPAAPEVIAQHVLPQWLGAGPTVAAVGDELPGDARDLRAHDVVVRDPATSAGLAEPVSPAKLVEPGKPVGVGEPAGAAEATGVDRVVLAGDRLGVDRLLLIDAEHDVVRGRYGPFGPEVPRAELRVGVGPAERGWRITGRDGTVHCAGSLDRPWLTERDRAALADVGVLVCRPLPGRHPRAEAALLLHLVLAGVLVYAPDLPPACRAPLTDEVARLLGAALPAPRAEELEWEVRAVRQRRAVLRGHARGLVLPGLVAAEFPGIPELPTVTALLVTRRPAELPAALGAVEAQTYPRLEIVLGLHGVEVPAGLRARLDRCGRPLRVVSVPAGQSFGAALGTATAYAQGSLLVKFDDDDTYGPEHVWDLVLARHHSGATLVGKGAEFVHLAALDTTVRRAAGAPESFAPLVAGGTMLIGRGDLEQVGGWRPVPRSVDRGLIERVRAAGGLIYRTHPLGYVYRRRATGHTWDPGLEYFLRGGGAQWPGLPRHDEFGTVPSGLAGTAEADARPPDAAGAPAARGGSEGAYAPGQDRLVRSSTPE